MEQDKIEYDKHVSFYWSNLINALKLFSYSKSDLEELIAPAFDPIFELESEIDYAFTPVCFETIFRNNRINERFKEELLDFKKQTDEIPGEIWDWEFLDKEKQWIEVRKKANELLDKMGIADRKYSEDYTTVYDEYGNIIKQGKKAN